MLRKLVPPSALLLAGLAYFAAPAERVSAGECGDKGPYLCETTETCRGWWIFKKCKVTDYKFTYGL